MIHTPASMWSMTRRALFRQLVSIAAGTVLARTPLAGFFPEPGSPPRHLCLQEWRGTLIIPRELLEWREPAPVTVVLGDFCRA